MDALWTLQSNPGLDERGSPLLTDAPVEYLNACSLTEGVLAQRQGFSSISFGGGFSEPIQWIGEFLTNTGARELWVAGTNAGVAAMFRRVGSVWSAVSFSDTVNTADLIYMQGMSMNGKFFLAYNSDVNRLHVWDGTSVRRVGFAQASAVTAATMGGAGLTFNRWYRKRVVVIESGVVTRRSEPSAVSVNVSITDDAGVTVTRGTVPGEGETDWEVEASDDVSGAPSIWYRIATVSIGTLTSDDTNAAIDTFEISDETGLYVPPPSAKYLSTDGQSLLMGGAWELTAATGETIPKRNRAWFTPPLGSSDVGDDERIPDTTIQHNWIDIGDAGPITALSGPVYNDTIVFKEHAVAKLTPTGDVTSPYALTVISAAPTGAVDQRLVASGELGGMPAILFADRNALYALTSGGIVTLSEPVGRSFRTTTIAADTGLVLFDAFQRMAFVQTSLASGGQAGTYTSYTVDVMKKRWAGFVFGAGSTGWVLGTDLLGITTTLGGATAEILNGVLATNLDGVRRLHVCGSDYLGNPSVLVWGDQCTLDGQFNVLSPTRGAFTTTARFRKMVKPGYRATFGAPTVWYRNPQGTATTVMGVTVTYQRDFDETRTASFTMTATDVNNGIAVAQETLEGLAAADVSFLDVTVDLEKSTGGIFASEVTPTIDAIVIPYTVGEPLAQ